MICLLYLNTEIICLILRMILKAIRDDDGGKPLLVLVVRQMILVTLVVALSPLANTGTAVTVVGRCQLYLTTGSSLI